MAIVEFSSGTVRHRSLMNKSKHDLASMCMELFREVWHLRDQLKWQPIETAPKDMSKILIGYFPGTAPDWIRGSYASNGWKVASWLHGRWWEGNTPLNSSGDFSPTHWRPLPPPPQEGE